MTNVRVPVTNLFSGVARQPASKRLTSELEEVDNAILTLERSAEKRPPMEFIQGGEADGSLDFLGNSTDDNPDDVAYFFFDKTDTERYLIMINRAVASASEDLIKIVRINDAIAEDLTTNPIIHIGDAVISDDDQTVDYSEVNSVEGDAATGTIQFINFVDDPAIYDDQTFTVTSTDGTVVVYTLNDDSTENTYDTSATSIGIQGAAAASKVSELVTAAGNNASNAHADKITFVEGASATVHLTQDIVGADGNNTIATSDPVDITVNGFTDGTDSPNTGAHDYKNYLSHDYYKPIGSYAGKCDDLWEYIAFNPNSKPLREILKATFFGNALVVLNSEVPATSWTTAVSSSPAPASLATTHPRSRKLTYKVAAVPDSLGHSNMGNAYDVGEEVMIPVGGCHEDHELSNMSAADGSGQIILATMYVNNLSQSWGVGTIDLGVELTTTPVTLKSFIANINGCSIPTSAGGSKAFSQFGQFYVSTDEGVTANVDGDSDGKLYFNTYGTNIVQFYDNQSGTTALTLGLSGTTGTFDVGRIAGKNLQPFVAATDSSVGSTAKSWGGAETGGDVSVMHQDGIIYTGAVPAWSEDDDFEKVRSAFETAMDFSPGPGFTLTLNTAKTGFYPVDEDTGMLPEVISGADDDGIAMCNKYGWTYSSAMHTSVRDDIVTTGDVIVTEIGQNIPSFDDIELPPEGDDVNRVNSEEDAVAALYEDGNINGYGKVWYCRKGFLTFPAGFYRCVSNIVIPHYNQVRSEEEHSVWYEPSFPFMLLNTGDGDWSVEYPKWNPRETGTSTSNPGPQAFSDGAKTIISDLAFWRERLFFATQDMVFSSRNNDWFNLWLDNPDNITSDDPIDIRASSGKFTRITFMIPFSDFMFINTGGETQYELQGSNNVISPTTAELAPTSFYSSSQIVEPLVLGTQIYWFDRERLYLYNSSAGTSVNNATEVSIHAHGYLPEKVRCGVVAAAQDSIYSVDDDEPNKLYVYTARWSGGEIVQNSFYRYILPQTVVTGQLDNTGWDTAPEWDSVTGLTTLPAPEVEFLWYVRNYLYMIVIRPCSDGTMKRFMERTALMFHDINIPRVDRQVEIPNATTDVSAGDTINYDGVSITTIKLPYWDPSIDKAIPGSSWTDDSGTALAATNFSNVDDTANTKLEVAGNWDYETEDYPLYMRTGSNYTMRLEMSRIVYRDPSSQLPIDGTLNLKMMNIQHFKTGVYDVEITRNNRVNSVTGILPSTVVTHSPLQINNDEDALGALLVEGEGEFTTKIMGFSDTTTVAITSDYTTPVAISSLDFTGMFKPTNSSIAP